MYLGSSQELVSDERIKNYQRLRLSVDVSVNDFIIRMKFILCVASPHTSTPNIGSVRHADSRGSLVSTDSGNSIPEKTNEKTSSLDKVQLITVMISIRPKIISYLPCLNRISCLHIMYCESDAQIGFDLTLSFKNNVTVNGGIECSGGVPSSSTCAQGGFNWSCDVFTLPHVSNTLHEHVRS